MQKCRELSKLPKATKSINFRHTTPGSLGNLFGWTPSPHKTTEVVDPTHPATKLPKSAYKRALPKFLHADIQIHAFPKALLTKPDVRWPNPPYKWAPEVQWSEQLEAIQRASGIERTLSSGLGVKPMKVNTVDMSVACVVGKKATHKKSTIRKTIVRRLKNAVSLLVTRGANARMSGQGKNGGRRLQLILNDDGKLEPYEWILSEWTYVFIPTMSIYRMPYPEMVSLLRKALENIYTRAKVVEAKWVSDANKPEFNAEKQKERQDSMERASQAQAVYRDMVEESSARRPQSPIRIQISKTPFGLRPPPEELLPEADPVPASSANSPIRVSLSRIFKDIPCDPSSENEQSFLQTSTSSTSPSSSPIPRLFFPTFSQNQLQTPANAATSRSDSDLSENASRGGPSDSTDSTGDNHKARLFRKRSIIKISPISRSAPRNR